VNLHDHKAALCIGPRAPRSVLHSEALAMLCEVHKGLAAFPAARKAIVEALAILEELGLQQDPQYGLSLVALGELESEQVR
jgi:hypothetical protein